MSDARPDLRKLAEEIVRGHEWFCIGHSSHVEAWCSAAPDGAPLCYSCQLLADKIAQALAGVAAGAARPPTAEEFRSEVRDKLGVVFNGCNSTPLQRSAARQQCEDFLVALHDQAVAASRPRLQEPGTGWLSRQIARTTRDMDDLPTWLGGRLDVDALREELRALRAASRPRPQEGGPITLNVGQVNAARAWAADDRLWTTQNTVESNLQTFARLILKLAASPSPQEPDAKP